MNFEFLYQISSDDTGDMLGMVAEKTYVGALKKATEQFGENIYVRCLCDCEDQRWATFVLRHINMYVKYPAKYYFSAVKVFERECTAAETGVNFDVAKLRQIYRTFINALDPINTFLMNFEYINSKKGWIDPPPFFNKR